MNMCFEVRAAFGNRRQWVRLASVLTVAGSVWLAAGCSTRSLNAPAPVEDRTSGARPAEASAADTAAKPGYYTVKPGDTLYRIALEAGQSPRDVQTWNNLPNPNVLEVGQVLRVAPPGAPAGNAAVSAVPVTGAGVVARPLTPAAPGTPEAAQPAAAAAPAPATPEPGSSASEIGLVWPAQGVVIAPFDEGKNKGLSIGGRLGEAVVAAADGRVVYAGAGLRGYGNLIILKHNNTFLTAYAHNQALLVREDQTVKQGQRIAEMGSSDSDRVKLHFELRRNGKPVDPLVYLPRR